MTPQQQVASPLPQLLGPKRSRVKRVHKFTKAANFFFCVLQLFEFIEGDKVCSVKEVIATASSSPAQFQTIEIKGRGDWKNSGAFEVPFEGKAFQGQPLVNLVESWVKAGSAEPSLTDSVKECVSHPEWFDLRGQAFILIGATSEMGPLEHLLSAGPTDSLFMESPARSISG